MQLSEQHRQKLDGIVAQMEANSEPEENIRLVVEDFKQKYGGPQEQVDVKLDFNPPEEKTLAGFGGNLLESGAKFAGDIGQAVAAAPGLISSAVTNPAQVGQAALEGAKGIPGYLAERYGGPQEILDTLYKDPVGFAADLSTLLSGAGAAAKVGNLGKVAEGLSKAATLADPVSLAVGAVKKPVMAGTGYAGKKALAPSLRASDKGAIAFAAREGIPLTADVRTGSPVLAGVKALGKHLPSSASKLADADEATVIALQEAGFRIADRLAPGKLSKVSVGEALAGDVSSEAKRYGKKAGSRYERLKGVAAENVEEVEVGEKVSPIVDEFGREIKTPITENIETPVNVADVKRRLRPIYDEMTRLLPQSRREASPGYTVLKQLMEGPDTVSLKTANENLSTIKSIGRSDIPELVTKSERIAKAVTQPLNQAVNEAAVGLGRQAEVDLLKGKYFTQKKYSYQELLAMAEKEPVNFVRSLTRNDDASIRALRDVASKFPKRVPQMAKAVLTDILEDATEKGGFGGQKALSEWLKIGPETKRILFPNLSMRHNLDKFFRLGFMVAKDVNPSGTAKVGNLAATAGMMLSSPMRGAAYLASTSKLADLLIEPQGVERVLAALRQARGLKPSKLTKASTAVRVTERDEP